jgi:cardiolipin synthase
MSSAGKNNSNGYTKQNNIRLVKGGAEYFGLLEKLINHAQHSVLVQTYIFDDDTTGTMIGEALMCAAKRGVAVYFMADGYASQNISRVYIHNLESAGVHFRYFEPLFRSRNFYIGRRLHHKVAVMDAKYALVGGINISDRYNDFAGFPAWLDTALYIEGEAVMTIFNLCKMLWGSNLETTLLPPADINQFINSLCKREYCSVRILRNDWLKRKFNIWKTYFNLFNNAEENITIMCSYFLPGKRLRKALERAAARGVKVRVILAGQSDIKISKWAERYLYDWMLRLGIEVYEYQPTVLHAKLAVVDDHWVIVGSYNINNISTYASIELNAEVRNRSFATKVTLDLDKIIANDCIRITAEKFKLTLSLFKKIEQHLSYLFINILLGLFTFYFKQEE